MQKPTGNNKVAKNYLAFGQYKCALAEYLILYQDKPTSIKYNRALAICYTGIPGLGGKAVKFSEFVINKGKYTRDDLYIHAVAYHQKGDYEKAITTAEQYLSKYNPTDIELDQLEHLISQCKSAIQLTKFPLNVKFENLGPKLNSEWEDFNPFCTPNEGKLMFSTTRSNVMGGYSYGNGYLTDVFISKLKGKKYSKPRSIGSSINSIDIDELAGTSSDGRYIFISTDSEGFQIFNLKMSYMKPRGRSYPKPTTLDGINGKESNEMGATITKDGSTIIFSSDRPGGIGGLDLYISRKLPDGKWGTPVNLGPEINSPQDDNYPRFNDEETGIIFASTGHISMGGYDLFSSNFSESYTKWSTPKNLGYPLNTQYNDQSIWYLQKNRIAYKAHYDTLGSGMSDIHRLMFLDSTPQVSILNLTLSIETADSTTLLSLQEDVEFKKATLDSLIGVDTLAAGDDTLLIKQMIDSVNLVINELNVEIAGLTPNCFAEISVSNADTEEQYGVYKSNPIRGGVLMILEPGSYDLSIEANGYRTINKSLIVRDKTLFRPFIDKTYTFSKN